MVALSNPCINRGTSFVDDFKGTAPMYVLLMISESVATQFSLMIFDPSGVTCAVKSMRHPWKQFCR